jgi:hypothetical protein
MLPTKSKFHRGTGWLANGNEGPRLARTQGENLLFFRRLARPEGFEPPTPTFVALYSIQLSYGRALANPIFGGRDLTTSILPHKKSAASVCVLEPSREQHFAAQDQSVGPESPQDQDQRADSGADATRQLRCDRCDCRHHLQGESHGDEDATQKIKKISCASRGRSVSHSSGY